MEQCSISNTHVIVSKQLVIPLGTLFLNDLPFCSTFRKIHFLVQSAKILYQGLNSISRLVSLLVHFLSFCG